MGASLGVTSYRAGDIFRRLVGMVTSPGIFKLPTLPLSKLRLSSHAGPTYLCITECTQEGVKLKISRVLLYLVNLLIADGFLLYKNYICAKFHGNWIKFSTVHPLSEVFIENILSDLTNFGPRVYKGKYYPISMKFGTNVVFI